MTKVEDAIITKGEERLSRISSWGLCSLILLFLPLPIFLPIPSIPASSSLVSRPFSSGYVFMSSQAVQGGHPPIVTLRTLTHPPSSLQLLEGIKAAISDCRLNRPPPSLSRPSPISYNPLTHDPSPSPPFPLLSWQRDIDIFFKVEKNEPIICLPCRVCRSPASSLHGVVSPDHGIQPGGITRHKRSNASRQTGRAPSTSRLLK